MTPEEAKASLGVATGLIDNMLLQQGTQQEIPQEQAEMEQGEGMTAQQVEQPEMQESDIRSEFDQFKQEVSETIKQEIGSLKQTIEQALSEDEETNEED